MKILFNCKVSKVIILLLIVLMTTNMIKSKVSLTNSSSESYSSEYEIDNVNNCYYGKADLIVEILNDNIEEFKKNLNLNDNSNKKINDIYELIEAITDYESLKYAVLSNPGIKFDNELIDSSNKNAQDLISKYFKDENIIETKDYDLVKFESFMNNLWSKIRILLSESLNGLNKPFYYEKDILEFFNYISANKIILKNIESNPQLKDNCIEKLPNSLQNFDELIKDMHHETILYNQIHNNYNIATEVINNGNINFLIATKLSVKSFYEDNLWNNKVNNNIDNNNNINLYSLYNNSYNVFNIINGDNKISLDIKLSDARDSIDQILSVGDKVITINNSSHCNDINIYLVTFEKYLNYYTLRLIARSTISNSRKAVSINIPSFYVENSSLTVNPNFVLNKNLVFNIQDMTCQGKEISDIIRREMEVITQITNSYKNVIKTSQQIVKTKCDNYVKTNNEEESPKCLYAEDGICMFCNKNKFYLNGKCLDEKCPEGYYAELFNNYSNNNTDNSKYFMCLPCLSNCKTCSDKTKCTSCKEDKDFPFLYNNQCISSCPLFTFPDKNNGNKCVKCLDDCEICSDLKSCAKCKTKYLHQNICVDDCPNETYAEVNTNICIPCNSKNNCKTCSSAVSCISCKDNYFLKDQNCLENCPNNFYANKDDKTCRKCSEFCEKCSHEDNCISCFDSYNLHEGKCLSNCPEGTTSINNICVACNENCLNCLSTDINICIKCNSMTYLLNGECVTDCGVGRYGSELINKNNDDNNSSFETSRECKDCTLNCKSCNDEKKCQECKNNYHLFKNSLCLVNCPHGWTNSSISKKCLLCSTTSNCKTCDEFNLDKCTSCFNNDYYYEGVCVDKCPSNTYLEDRICKKCHASCLTCTNGATCSSCDKDMYMKKGICVNDCGIGYKLEEDYKTCKPCLDFNCSNCNSSVDICNKCLHPKVLFNGKCLDNCPSFYFNNTTEDATTNQKYSICERCKDNCFICTSKDNCNKCYDNFYLVKETNTCVSECPFGFTPIKYQSKNTIYDICQNCNINKCNKCIKTDNEYQCIECSEGHYLLDNKCVLNCPKDNYIQNNNTMQCNQCDYPCYNCLESTNICVSCLDNLNLTKDNTCSDECPINQVAVKSKCESCTQNNCDICDANDLSKCLKCNQTTYLLNGICYQTCPTGFYNSNNFDDINNKSNICKKCIDNCSYCHNNNECMICSKDYTLLNGKCVKECPLEYVKVNENDFNFCRKCSSGCNQCEETDTEICKSCIQNKYLFDNKCIDFCPEQYYSNEFNICNKCSVDDCSICSNNGKTCEKCTGSYAILNNKCLENCPSGFKRSDNKLHCEECLVDNCNNCDIDKNICNRCNKDFFKLSDDLCSHMCPLSTFPVKANSINYKLYSSYQNDQYINNICVKCNDKCLECVNSQRCNKCKNNFYLDNNETCVVSCEDGKAEDTKSGKCITCTDFHNCKKCDSNNPEICLNCKNDFYLTKEGKCVELCPEQYYENTNTKECSPCSLNCKNCSSLLKCNKCLDNFLIYNGVCTDNCPDYYVESGESCIECETQLQCLKCDTKDVTKCVKCKDNLILFDNRCINSCPETYRELPNKTCEKCINNCKNCDNNPLGCNSCIPPYNLLNKSLCVQDCGVGFYSTLNNECVQCEDNNCSNCSSIQNSDNEIMISNTCQECLPGFYLKSTNGLTECVIDCGDGYYGNNSLCMPCSDNNCTMCSNNYDCSYCNNELNLLNSNQCVVNCPFGKASVNYICEDCEPNCLICKENNLSDCLVCNNDTYLHKGDCLKDCPEYHVNSIDSKTNSNICIPCYDNNCLVCNSKNPEICSQCSNNLFIDPESNLCVESCPDKFFEYGSKCERCLVNGCKKCSGPDMKCDFCEDGLILSSLSNKCVEKCNSDEYITYTNILNSNPFTNNIQASLVYNNDINNLLNNDNSSNTITIKKCSKCKSCMTCQDITGTCKQCYEGYFLTSDNICKQNCNDGEIRINDECVKCKDEGCNKCKSDNISYCLECFSNMFLYNGDCYTECPISTYYNDENINTSVLTNSLINESNECKDCIANCLNCNDDKSCNTCKEGMVYQNTYCANECLPGYVAVSDGLSETSICHKCADYDRCNKCSSKDTSICLGCKSGFYLKNSKCVEECGSGYYNYSLGNNGGDICNPCSLNCNLCDNSLVCKVCDSNYKLYQNKCVKTCPLGTVVFKPLEEKETNYNIYNKCLPCNEDNCQICSQYNLDVCLRCGNGYSLKNNNCVQNCGIGYYKDTNNNCIKCSDNNCNNCSENNNICIDCKDNFFLLNGLCVSSCPKGYTYNSSDQCVKCSQELCSNCSSDNTNKCNECFIGYLHDNKCYELCPPGYFALDKICSPCKEGCLECDSSSNCFKCEKSYKLLINNKDDVNGNNKDNNYNCIDYCPKSTYSFEDKCLPCDDNANCLKCSENLIYCKICKTPLVSFKGQCITECPEGFYSNGTSCLECEDNCLSCSNKSNCLKCNSNTYLFNNDCIEECPKYTYPVISDENEYKVKKCIFCNDNEKCVKCDYLNPNICKLCSSGILYKGKCIDSCPSGTYYISSTNTCDNCVENCLKCNNEYECSQCLEKFVLHEGLCNLTTCPSGYISVLNNNNKSKECIQCTGNCNSCLEADTSHCSTCMDGFLLHENKCVPFCPERTYQTQEKGINICNKCNPKCLTCSDAEYCLSCEEPLFLDYLNKDFNENKIEGICVDKCSSGYIEINRKCVACNESSKCNKCKAEDTSICLECKKGLYLLNDICVDVCPDRYFVNSLANTCEPCLVTCNKCDNNYECLECLNGLHFVEKTSNQMLNKCDVCSERNVVINGVCKECKVDNCKICDSNSEFICSVCKSSFVMHNNICLIECPKGMYKDEFNNCQNCSANCLNCNDSNQCILCEEYNVLHNGKCLDECPKNYSPNILKDDNTISKRCVKCEDINCKLCDGNNASTCLECFSNYINHNNKCIQECPPNHLEVDAKCVKCIDNCYSCSNLSTCDICNSGFFISNDNKCTNKCESGYYANLDTKRCTECAVEYCSECDNSKCLKCEDDYILLNDSLHCVAHCPEGFYKKISSDKSLTCEKCKPGCNLCTNENNCFKCKDMSLVLYNNNCLADCPSKMSKLVSNQNISSTCVPCSDNNCFSCKLNQPEICNICDDEYYLLEGACVEHCPSKHFANIKTKSCDKCNNKCKSCTQNINNCLSCIDGYLLHENQCLNECPEGYTKNHNKCIPCQESENSNELIVKSCTVTPHGIISLTCYEPYVLYNNVCLIMCPDKTYIDEDTNSCVDCPIGCKSCLNSDNCTQCEENFFIKSETKNSKNNHNTITSTKCVQNCGKGFFGDCSSNQCQECSPACSSCYGNSNKDCFECKDNFINQDHACVPSNDCFSGYYANLENKTCQRCLVPYCKECSSALHCTECENNFNLTNGKCSKEGTTKLLLLGNLIQTPLSFDNSYESAYSISFSEDLNNFGSIGSKYLSISFWIKSLGITANLSENDISNVFAYYSNEGKFSMKYQIKYDLTNNNSDKKQKKCSLHIIYESHTYDLFAYNCSDIDLIDWNLFVINLYPISTTTSSAVNSQSYKIDFMHKIETGFSSVSKTIDFKYNLEFLIDDTSNLSLLNKQTSPYLGYKLAKLNVYDYKPSLDNLNKSSILNKPNSSISWNCPSNSSECSNGIIPLSLSLNKMNISVKLSDIISNQRSNNTNTKVIFRKNLESSYSDYSISFFFIFENLPKEDFTYNLASITYDYSDYPLKKLSSLSIEINSKQEKDKVLIDNFNIKLPNIFENNTWYYIIAEIKTDSSLKNIIYSIDVKDSHLNKSLITRKNALIAKDYNNMIKLFSDAKITFGNESNTGINIRGEIYKPIIIIENNNNNNSNNASKKYTYAKSLIEESNNINCLELGLELKCKKCVDNFEFNQEGICVDKSFENAMQLFKNIEVYNNQQEEYSLNKLFNNDVNDYSITMYSRKIAYSINNKSIFKGNSLTHKLLSLKDNNNQIIPIIYEQILPNYNSRIFIGNSLSEDNTKSNNSFVIDYKKNMSYYIHYIILINNKSKEVTIHAYNTLYSIEKEEDANNWKSKSHIIKLPTESSYIKSIVLNDQLGVEIFYEHKLGYVYNKILNNNELESIIYQKNSENKALLYPIDTDPVCTSSNYISGTCFKCKSNLMDNNTCSVSLLGLQYYNYYNNKINENMSVYDLKTQLSSDVNSEHYGFVTRFNINNYVLNIDKEKKYINNFNIVDLSNKTHNKSIVDKIKDYNLSNTNVSINNPSESLISLNLRVVLINDELKEELYFVVNTVDGKEEIPVKNNIKAFSFNKNKWILIYAYLDIKNKTFNYYITDDNIINENAELNTHKLNHYSERLLSVANLSVFNANNNYNNNKNNVSNYIEGQIIHTYIIPNSNNSNANKIFNAFKSKETYLPNMPTKINSCLLEIFDYSKRGTICLKCVDGFTLKHTKITSNNVSVLSECIYNTNIDNESIDNNNPNTLTSYEILSYNNLNVKQKQDFTPQNVFSPNELNYCLFFRVNSFTNNSDTYITSAEETMKVYLQIKDNLIFIKVLNSDNNSINIGPIDDQKLRDWNSLCLSISQTKILVYYNTINESSNSISNFDSTSTYELSNSFISYNTIPSIISIYNSNYSIEITGLHTLKDNIINKPIMSLLNKKLFINSIYCDATNDEGECISSIYDLNNSLNKLERFIKIKGGLLKYSPSIIKQKGNNTNYHNDKYVTILSDIIPEDKYLRSNNYSIGFVFRTNSNVIKSEKNSETNINSYVNIVNIKLNDSNGILIKQNIVNKNDILLIYNNYTTNLKSISNPAVHIKLPVHKNYNSSSKFSIILSVENNKSINIIYFESEDNYTHKYIQDIEGEFDYLTNNSIIKFGDEIVSTNVDQNKDYGHYSEVVINLENSFDFNDLYSIISSLASKGKQLACLETDSNNKCLVCKEGYTLISNYKEYEQLNEENNYNCILKEAILPDSINTKDSDKDIKDNYKTIKLNSSSAVYNYDLSKKSISSVNKISTISTFSLSNINKQTNNIKLYVVYSLDIKIISVFYNIIDNKISIENHITQKKSYIDNLFSSNKERLLNKLTVAINYDIPLGYTEVKVYIPNKFTSNILNDKIIATNNSDNKLLSMISYGKSKTSLNINSLNIEYGESNVLNNIEVNRSEVYINNIGISNNQIEESSLINYDMCNIECNVKCIDGVCPQEESNESSKKVVRMFNKEDQVEEVTSNKELPLFEQVESYISNKITKDKKSTNSVYYNYKIELSLNVKKLGNDKTHNHNNNNSVLFVLTNDNINNNIKNLSKYYSSNENYTEDIIPENVVNNNSISITVFNEDMLLLNIYDDYNFSINQNNSYNLIPNSFSLKNFKNIYISIDVDAIADTAYIKVKLDNMLYQFNTNSISQKNIVNNINVSNTKIDLEPINDNSLIYFNSYSVEEGAIDLTKSNYIITESNLIKENNFNFNIKEKCEEDKLKLNNAYGFVYETNQCKKADENCQECIITYNSFKDAMNSNDIVCKKCNDTYVLMNGKCVYAVKYENRSVLVKNIEKIK